MLSSSISNSWPDRLFANLEVATAASGTKWRENYQQRLMATSGASVASRKSSINSELAKISLTTDYILCNFGANDVSDSPTESAWKTDYQYLIDAFLTKWPAVKIYITKPWRRGYADWCNTFADWIDDIVAIYAISKPDQVFVGDDERTWFEHGDDGVTFGDSNGVHYNEAGEVAKAIAVQAAMGY